MNVVLGTLPFDRCEAADTDGDGVVRVNDLVAAVAAALGVSGEQVVLDGVCRRPGRNGQNLRACEDGTEVRAARCDDPVRCLHDAAGRTVIGAATRVAGGAGRFSILVPEAEVSSAALIVMEADLRDEQQLVFPYFAVIDLGSASALAAPQASAVDAMVTIDPSSTGTLRIIDLRGADRFSDAEIDALTQRVRDDPRAQYGDLSLSCAADLGAGIAASVIAQLFQGSTLSGPTALAVDAGGNVFVAAGASNNVFRISPSGEIRQIIDRNGDGAGHSLDLPYALATDATGNLFVAGRFSNNVFRITPEGNIQQIIDTNGDGRRLAEPFALAVDSQENVFVAGSVSNNVFRIAPNGEVRQIIDRRGDGRRPLDFPDALAADLTGNVFVSGDGYLFRITPAALKDVINPDAEDPVVVRLAANTAGTVAVGSDIDGRFLQITPSGELQQIPFAGPDGGISPNFPNGLGVDAMGRVLTSVFGGVFRITPGEAAELIITQNSVAGHPLIDAIAPIVDSVGNVFVAGRQSNNVVRMRPDRVVDQIIDATGDGSGFPLDSPTAVGVDGGGNVFVAGFYTDNVVRIAPDGSARQLIDGMGDGNTRLYSPEALAVDAAGNAFVGSANDGVVFQISPGGEIRKIIDEAIAGTHIGSVQDLAATRTGDVYVAGRDGLFQVTPSGAINQLIPDRFIEIGDLVAIAVDATGTLFVAGGNGVFRITAAGAFAQINDHRIVEGGPIDLVVDGAGNVYVAGQRSVVRITPGGEIEQIIDAMGDKNGHGFEDATALTIDAAGTVFVAARSSRNVFRITAGGIIEQIIDQTGDGFGHELIDPSALTTDAGGNVYVTDADTNAVFKISPCGNALTVTP